MSTQHYIYSQKGKPFSDFDAATEKARILTEEVGEQYTVVTLELGYAIVRDQQQSVDTESEPEPMPNPQISEISKIPEIPEIPGLAQDESTSTDEKAPELIMPDYKSEFGLQDSEVLLKEMEEEKRKEKEALENEIRKYRQSQQQDPKKQSINNSSVINLRPSFKKFFMQYLLALISILISQKPEVCFLPFMSGSEIAANGLITGLMGTIELVAYSGLIYFGFQILIPILSNRYKINGETIETQKGIISRDSTSILIEDIKTADVNQSIIDRFFDIGTVELSTSGTAGTDIVLWGINDPVSIKRIIRNRQKESGDTVSRTQRL